jgi:glyoxylase-like metal-dependent hydrolase (beta-lactamase superfamily II)
VDDVVVTHYHADHTGGIGSGGMSAGRAAAASGGATSPLLQATSATLELLRADDVRRQRASDPERTAALDRAVLLDPERPAALDLGGRTLRVVPRTGHTASDVSLELDDPSIVIAGDLLWNGMFPNYVDALPSALARSVRALVRGRETVYLPGHGAVADGKAVARYLEVLDLVEAAARRAHQQGVAAADAAKEFALPPSLGEWYMFSPRYY